MSPILPRAVMWHYVRSPDQPPLTGYRGVTPEAFAVQLDTLCAVATPVDWGTVSAALAGTRRLPRDGVLLTFDDGLMDHHRVVLPMLTERGLSGVFFVLARQPGDGLSVGHRLHVLLGRWPADRVCAEVSDRLVPADRDRYRAAQEASANDTSSDPDDAWKRPLQRELAAVAGPILRDLVEEAAGPDADVAEQLYMSASELEGLVDAGMTLGGHGRTHPWLDALTADRRRGEIAASARFLAQFQPGPLPFAYPYGGVPRRAGSLLAGAGFAAGFTTADARTDRYHIGRADGDDPDWLATLAPGPST